MLVKGEAAASCLPPGQEAVLLLAQMQAINTCLKAAARELPATGAGAAVGAAGASSGSGNSGSSNSPALYGELLAAVKLASKRLKLLGWAKFAGAAAGGEVGWR